MLCHYCTSEKTVKIGFQAGKRRHRCKMCRKTFTENPGKSYPEELKRQALQLYLEGLGFRSIGRFLKISHVTVFYWIRQMGTALPETKTPSHVVILEMDELWHFIKKRQQSFECGLLLTVQPVRSLTLNSVAVALKR